MNGEVFRRSINYKGFLNYIYVCFNHILINLSMRYQSMYNYVFAARKPDKFLMSFFGINDLIKSS